MLRSVISRGSAIARSTLGAHLKKQIPAVTACRTYSKTPSVPDEGLSAMEKEFIKYIDHPETDGWEIRALVTDIQGGLSIPDPQVITALMRACRRLNDYALAIRILEAFKYKCGPMTKTFWPYIMGEIQPTLDELGILSIEEMGYDKPELFLEDVFDMH